MRFDDGAQLIFVSDGGLKILMDSKYVIVDGTFDLVEGNLVLTTMMGYHDDIAIPCAYYLSELKTHNSYYDFFEVTCVCSLSHACLHSTHAHSAEDQRTDKW